MANNESCTMQRVSGKANNGLKIRPTPTVNVFLKVIDKVKV